MLIVLRDLSLALAALLYYNRYKMHQVIVFCRGQNINAGRQFNQSLLI